jgi:hypothetical protein
VGPEFTVHKATPEWAPHVVEFLLDVAFPEFPYAPNIPKGAEVVRRVISEHLAIIMLDSNLRIVGSVGLIPMSYWWCDRWFLGNVWLFTRDGFSVVPMLNLMRKLARTADVEIYIQSEPMRKVWLFNSKWKRHESGGI